MKIISFSIILLWLSILVSCSRKPESVLKDYIQTHNSHNIKRELFFYDDSITFEIENTWVKKGKDKMRELVEWDSTLNSHLELDILHSQQDSLWCRVTERNDWFLAAGIDKLIHDSTVFIMQNDKIKSIYAAPADDEIKKIVEVISSVYQWFNITGDSTIYELIKNKEFVYSSETAIKWLKLFKRMKGDKIKQ